MKGKRKKRPGCGDTTLLTEFDQSSTLAYLHGDVVDGEHEAACDYEYSRESPVLRAAARSHRQGLSFEEIGEGIDQAFSCGDAFLGSPWREFFSCAHFPKTPWNSLSSEDRREILSTLLLPYGSRKPVLMHDVRRLERVLQALKEKAAKARAEQTAKKVLPLLHEGQITYALLVLDASKTKKQHVAAFDALLELPEMKERLKEYRDSPTGKTGAHKDRLKDLAAWRLYDHFRGDWRKANDFASEHRKVFERPAAIFIGSGKNRKKIAFKKGDLKPFHDPRQGQGEHQINEASLYSEESGFLKAKGKALAYLRQRMPWEFFRKAAEEELEKMRTRIKRLS